MCQSKGIEGKHHLDTVNLYLQPDRNWSLTLSHHKEDEVLRSYGIMSFDAQGGTM